MYTREARSAGNSKVFEFEKEKFKTSWNKMLE